jgi:molecular chaperone GrpE
MSAPVPPPLGDEPDRVVIRDKRKIDPVTGEARPAADPGDLSAPAAANPVAESGQVPLVEASLLDERTADLQRLQAEYANYRKRADRDRLAAGDAAVARALTELLPVLDDIDRARAHGDVSGPFEVVVDKLTATLEKLGLESFGTEGDEFDPKIHEAVLHTESPDVSTPTCTTVMRRGYRHGERLLRPAMVGVTDPSVEPVRSAPGDVQEDTEAAKDETER